MNRPVISFRHGSCRASVFENEFQRGDETFIVHSVAFQRSYMDQEGNWQRTSSLNTNDIPKAVIVLQKAYEYITFKPDPNDRNGEDNGQGIDDNGTNGNTQPQASTAGAPPPPGDDDLPF